MSSSNHITTQQRFENHWGKMKGQSRKALKRLADNPVDPDIISLAHSWMDTEEEFTKRLGNMVIKNINLPSIRRMVEEARV